MIDEQIELTYRADRLGFDNPNWANQQAHRIGVRQALLDIKDLLNVN